MKLAEQLAHYAEDRSAKVLALPRGGVPVGLQIARQLGIAKRVTFWGKQKDVRPFYAAADFFVLPTLYDPFPSVALEAMASGLPVILTRQCGAAEIIKPEREGFVLDFPEDRRLSEYLQIMNLKSHTMAEAARHLAEQFPTERTIRETLALYEKVLN